MRFTFVYLVLCFWWFVLVLVYVAGFMSVGWFMLVYASYGLWVRCGIVCGHGLLFSVGGFYLVRFGCWLLCLCGMVLVILLCVCGLTLVGFGVVGFGLCGLLVV